MECLYLEIRNGDISVVYDDEKFVSGCVTKCGEMKQYSNEKDFLSCLDFYDISINDMKQEYTKSSKN